MLQPKDIANDSWKRLYFWLSQNGLEGYDPYSIKEMPFYYWITKWPQLLPLKVIRFPIMRLIEFYPALWIRLFHLPPKVISKGLGLLASSYLSLYRKTGEKKYLKSADQCFDLLGESSVKGFSGHCWGVPFVWQFPSGTPCSVASIIIGHAYWARYQTFGQDSDLAVCQSICDFLVNDLNRDDVSPDEVCFSYTPLDRTHILNGSLFSSEFLIRIGKELKNRRWVELGEKGVNYVLRNQQEDGSFWYFGPEDEGLYPISSRTLKKVDGYHTGFILRMLKEANKLLSIHQLEGAIERGLYFYLNNFIDEKRGIPFTHLNIHRHRIDIHGCAEALLILNAFADYDSKIDELLPKVLIWVIKNMQDPSGYFYYEKTPIITKKIAYLRWGQAWMARALTDIIESR